MYLEFLILICDYFRTLRNKFHYVLFEWIFPFTISLVCFFLIKNCMVRNIATDFFSTGVTLLGILIAFSITVLTILTTNSSSNIEEIKKTNTECKIGKRIITLYELLLINLSYSVIVEILLLILNICLPLIWINFYDGGIKFFLVVDVLLICHILFLILRNTTDFYFILFKKKKAKEDGNI